MISPNIKNHILDLIKAVLAAAGIAAVQALISYLTNLHLGNAQHALNAVGAFAALKLPGKTNV